MKKEDKYEKCPECGITRNTEESLKCPTCKYPRRKGGGGHSKYDK